MPTYCAVPPRGRTGSSLFLISDFHDADNDTVRKELFQLARHTEITAIHCRDPLEETLPPPGLYAVTDGAHRCTLRTGDRDLRQRYDEAAARQHEAIDALFRKLAIPRIQASTVDAPLSVLRGYYGKYGKAGR